MACVESVDLCFGWWRCYFRCCRLHAGVQSGSLWTNSTKESGRAGTDQLSECHERSVSVPQRKHDDVSRAWLKEKYVMDIYVGLVRGMFFRRTDTEMKKCFAHLHPRRVGHVGSSASVLIYRKWSHGVCWVCAVIFSLHPSMTGSKMCLHVVCKFNVTHYK